VALVAILVEEACGLILDRARGVDDDEGGVREARAREERRGREALPEDLEE